MLKIKRRGFLKLSLFAGAYVLHNSITPSFCLGEQTTCKEALYYQKLSQKQTQCLKCPHLCLIKNGNRGMCRIRENQDGKLINIVYAKPCAVHIDPIEKKPFFHVLPGTKSFSIATVGCNLRCKFCQNWQISQAEPEQVESMTMFAQDIVSKAKQSECKTIAYTYTEPTVFYEYTLDTAILALSNGIRNVMHSNGYINPEPLRKLCPNFCAINVDLKAFSEEFYQNICQGNLQNVLDSLVIIKKELGVWLELTNLIIPTLNDNPLEIKKMCVWIRENLGDDVPLHFSRFFPMYKLMSVPPTPVSVLEAARDIAIDCGLKFVYIGNIPGHTAENTYCPNCRKSIIKRSGYIILENNLKDGKCGFCQELIQGVWV